MKDLSIDRPSAEQAERIVKKMYHSIPESSSGMFSLSELRPVEEVYSDFLERGDSLLFLGGQGEILRHIHFGPHRDDRFTFNVSGHIYDLYAKKEHRGKGARRILLWSALDELKALFSSITPMRSDSEWNGVC